MESAILHAVSTGDMPAQVIYVHGIGAQAEPVTLKRQYDTALFGRPLAERTRVAYWSDILHPLPGPERAAGGLGIRGLAESVAPHSEALAPSLQLMATANPKAQEWADRLHRKMVESAPVGGDQQSLAAAWERAPEAGVFKPKILPPGPLRRLATEWLTRAFLQDVAAYFFEEEIRDAIQDRLRDLLVAGPVPYVLVTHSLGTVITYDVLRTLDADIRVALWVTLGSPLGIDEVQDQIVQPLNVPDQVRSGKWFNFADRLDPVALDPSLADEFKPAGFVQDRMILNPFTTKIREFNPHAALGYLSHSDVRNTVRGVVGPTFAAPTANFVMAADVAAEAVGPPVRHHVLIQLDDSLQGSDLTQRGEHLVQELTELTGGDPEACIDPLRRYVAAMLTPYEVQTLRARYQELSVQRLWKNSRKTALLKTSTHRLQARTAQLGYQAVGKGIGWAVLDTGIREDHPHFATYNNIVSRWNCTLPGRRPVENDARDEHGHGTHVAGIIAGQERDLEQKVDREDAYYGMAPQTQLHVYKVLNDDGDGQDSWIIKALDHIASINERSGALLIHGVNLSLGGPFDPEVFGCGHSPLCQELRRLWRMGVIVCLAAGNEGVADLATLGADGETLESIQLNADLSIGDPANLEDAISVGSVHKEFPHLYGVSYFSSRGPTADGRAKPDVVAPGEKIVSCNAHFREEHPDTHYVPASGTSMACPHVAGLLAGYLSVRREFTGRPDEVKRLLLRHAIDLGRDRMHQGAGMPNLIHMLAGT